MKKRKVLNLCLFTFALLFVFVMVTNADGCVLGEETTKDVKGALKIFRIVAPLALLGFTILDAIKAVTKVNFKICKKINRSIFTIYSSNIS